MGGDIGRRQRVGLGVDTGGSGGGVLTAWIVGMTDRFKAAVVAKPVINWISFALTADGIELNEFGKLDKEDWDWGHLQPGQFRYCFLPRAPLRRPGESDEDSEVSSVSSDGMMDQPQERSVKRIVPFVNPVLLKYRVGCEHRSHVHEH